jgi:predicted nucleotidyltransferase
MAELARLGEALHQLTRVLDELRIPYMVIGGIANLVWGEARATQDVDVTVSISEERTAEVVEALGQHLTLLPNDPVAFLRQTRVLPMTTASGVGIDLIRAGLPYEEAAIARAQFVDLGGAQVRVAGAEDLILHKLVSERLRDREDVAGVIRRQRAKLDREYLDPLVRSLAEMLERPEIWDWYFREVTESD